MEEGGGLFEVLAYKGIYRCRDWN